MFTDSTLVFSSAQAITTTADSTDVIDITGAGSGNAPAMIGGNGNVIGADWGLGDGSAVPYVIATVTTAGTGAGTMTISLKAAPDNGSNGQGSYSTLYTSTTFVGTSLTKGTQIVFQVPPTIPSEALPRFYKLTYTVSGSFTVTLDADLVLNPPSSIIGGQYPNNYVAA